MREKEIHPAPRNTQTYTPTLPYTPRSARSAAERYPSERHPSAAGGSAGGEFGSPLISDAGRAVLVDRSLCLSQLLPDDAESGGSGGGGAARVRACAQGGGGGSQRGGGGGRVGSGGGGDEFTSLVQGLRKVVAEREIALHSAQELVR